MKIQIMSDLHLDSSKCIIDVEEADIVLILGDTTYRAENWYWLFDRLNGDQQNREELLSDDEIDFLDDYIPYMDNEEVHIIEGYSLEIYLDGVLYE